jgi:hypothetical protein
MRAAQDASGENDECSLRSMICMGRVWRRRRVLAGSRRIGIDGSGGGFISILVSWRDRQLMWVVVDVAAFGVATHRLGRRRCRSSVPAVCLHVVGGPVQLEGRVAV